MKLIFIKHALILINLWFIFIPSSLSSGPSCYTMSVCHTVLHLASITPFCSSISECMFVIIAQRVFVVKVYCFGPLLKSTLSSIFCQIGSDNAMHIVDIAFIVLLKSFIKFPRLLFSLPGILFVTDVIIERGILEQQEFKIYLIISLFLFPNLLKHLHVDDLVSSNLVPGAFIDCINDFHAVLWFTCNFAFLFLHNFKFNIGIPLTRFLFKTRPFPNVQSNP